MSEHKEKVLLDDQLDNVVGGKKPKKHKYPYVDADNAKFCNTCKGRPCIGFCEVPDALYMFCGIPHCDHSLCNGCGECSRSCPCSVLIMEY